MNKGLVYLMIVFLSAKWMFRIVIGDKVIYQGKRYIVANGVRPSSWRLCDLNNRDNGWVKRSKCEKVKTLANILGSFKSGYSFYMGYWYNIWVNSGIEPWMKTCNIWG